MSRIHDIEPTTNEDVSFHPDLPGVTSFKGISRRDFIKFAIGGLGATLMASCKPFRVLAPAFTDTPILTPTLNPATEVAPTQTPESDIVISQEYLNQEQILAMDPLVSGLFSQFQSEIKQTKPDTAFSAWGSVTRTSTGKQYFTPFFEISENGILAEEYVVRAKSDGSALITLRLQQAVVVAEDGQEYYTLSQVTNADTLEAISPTPLIYIGIPKAQFDAMNPEQQALAEVYFNAFGGILPQNSPDIRNIGSFTSAGKNEKYRRILVPLPEGLNNLPEGLVPVRNSDGTWGIGVNQEGQTVSIPDVSFDSTGLHIAGRVDVGPEDIAKRVKVGQNSPFQIYNEEGTAILYAYDAENRALINSADVLQPDNSNPEKYIHIQSLDDLKNLARLEKMVLPPFPDTAHSWDPSKFYLDYCNMNNKGNPDDDVSWWYPLGSLPEGKTSGFRYVNYLVLGKNESEGRHFDSYIYTEQVYNPDDGSFSVMHYGPVDIFKPWLIQEFASFTQNDYSLPGCYISVGNPALATLSHYLKTNNLMDSSGNMSKIQQLTQTSLQNGHISSELETIPLFPVPYFKKQ